MAANSTTQSVGRNTQENVSLYERLGGAAGIAAIVDDIADAHLANPAIKARYLPLLDMPDHLEEVKRHLRDFLGAGSGGPEQYTGRSMVDTHRGMNVGEAEYMAVLDDIMGVLKKHGIDEQTRKDILAISFGLKDEILHL